jgi:PAS domain S-box-containing protein
MQNSKKTKDELEQESQALRQKLFQLESILQEQKKIETRLKESEQKYRSVVEQANDGIAIVQDTIIKFTNPRLAVMVGADELINRSLADIVSFDRLPHHISENKPYKSLDGVTPTYEAALRHKDGKKIPVEFSAGVITYEGRPAELVVIRDITDRKNFQERLLEAQKLELVGRLTGGIAHDFNNFLMAIINYAVLVKKGLPMDSLAHDDINQIVMVGKRAAVLVRQLLLFSQRHIGEPCIINLNDLLSNLSKMLRHLIREDIELAILLQADYPFIKADSCHLEQVVINLVINARDAMPSGGKLEIETSNLTLRGGPGDGHKGLAAGHYLVLRVSDTGSGMDEGVKAHIFEPFFTTKKPGQGTGLGLSTVDNIVKQYGGIIEVASSCGKGTTFKIVLPAAEKIEAQDNRQQDSQALPTGSETIILVEDDSAVREVTTRILQKLGYNVLSTAHGEEALKAVRNYSDKIHLLLLDMVMPRLSGQEVARRILEIRPDIKVIFFSGYIDDTSLKAGHFIKGAAFLQKPFIDVVLAQKIRKVLDS